MLGNGDSEAGLQNARYGDDSNHNNRWDGDVCVKRHYGNGADGCGGDENGDENVRGDEDDCGYGLAQSLKGQRSRSCYCGEDRSRLSPSCCIPHTVWLDTGNLLAG